MPFLLTLIITLFMLPVTAMANEGVGLLSSDLDGALPKALWRNQPRTDIIKELKKMPADAPLRSLQQIKRNMLLSRYDTSLIKNDTKPSHENNLLTLRLQKLIKMGLWEDAFRLYSTTIDDPQDNNDLAQTGILLLLLEKGLATACLEEKVFNNRFDSPPFWDQIDNICSIEIGTVTPSTTDFAGSDVLKSLYEDDVFKINANNIQQLSTLSPLELALLSEKGRIDYQNIDLKRETPPSLIKTFLEDKKFPESEKEALNKIAIQQAILPETTLENNIDNLAPLPQKEVVRIIAQKLKRSQKISEPERQKLQLFAQDHPENYFYLRAINILQASETQNKITQEDILSSIEALSIKTGKKSAFLKSWLDKQVEFSHNPVDVYEKRDSLDSEGDVIAQEDEQKNKIDRLEKAIKSNHAGLSLLIMLSNVENSAWVKSSVDTSEKEAFNMLKSLSEVGLIDQAHQLAKEELANLMMLYKN